MTNIKELACKWGFYFEDQTGIILKKLNCFSCILHEKDVKKYHWIRRNHN